MGRVDDLNRLCVGGEIEVGGDIFVRCCVGDGLGFGVGSLGEGIAEGGAGKCGVSRDGERSDGGKYFLSTLPRAMLASDGR